MVASQLLLGALSLVVDEEGRDFAKQGSLVECAKVEIRRYLQLVQGRKVVQSSVVQVCQRAPVRHLCAPRATEDHDISQPTLPPTSKTDYTLELFD